MKKVIVLNIKALWNVELPRIVEFILNIVRKYSPEALHLGKRVQALEAVLPQLQQLSAQERASTFSVAINEKDAERDALISALYNVSKAFASVPLAEQSDAGAKLTAVFAKHNPDMAYSPAMIETQQIHNFCAEVDASAEVLAAIEKMALTPIYAALKTTNNEFESLTLQRTAEKSEKATIVPSTLKKSTSEALTALFDAINLNILEYPEVDYSALVNELNTFNTGIRSQLKARATRRKNGMKTEEEKPIQV